MWAAPSPLPHRNPSPPLTDTNKSVRSGRLSPTISTKFRRQSRLRADNSREVDIGRGAALRLDSQQQQRGRAKQRKQKLQEKEQQLQRQMSGVDVLWALQKASSQKIKKNHKKGWERVAEKGSRGREEGGGVAEAESTVRALCIKSEWGACLDDLEKQLRQLIHS